MDNYNGLPTGYIYDLFGTIKSSTSSTISKIGRLNKDIDVTQFYFIFAYFYFNIYDILLSLLTRIYAFDEKQSIRSWILDWFYLFNETFLLKGKRKHGIWNPVVDKNLNILARVS